MKTGTKSNILAAFCLILLAGMCVFAGQSDDESMYLIKGAKIFTSSAQGVLTDAALLIEKGQIKKIIRGDQIPSVPVRDYSGKSIMPGMVDAHSYISAYYRLLENRLVGFTERYLGDVMASINASGGLFLQPLTRIHLHSNMNGELSDNGDYQSVLIYSTIAGFVLFIAAVNFMNLSTARAVTRAREVGLRKVLGARRRRLIAQFLSESVLFCVLAFLMSLLPAGLVNPFFRAVNGWGIENPEPALWMVPVIAGIILLVGIGAGCYPAFVLSRYRPVHVLKNAPVSGTEGNRFRKVLVIIQFAVSIALMIGTGTIVRQLRFMKSAELGFDRDQLLVVNTTPSSNTMAEVIKREFRQSPNIVSISSASTIPGWGHFFQPVRPEGFAPNDAVSIKDLDTDYDFVETMALEIVMGRTFSRDIMTDETEAVIVNEAAVRMLGWENPIGKRLHIVREADHAERTIIGVIGDYHMESLHKPIDPLYILCDPGNVHAMLVRLYPGDMSGTVAFLREAWERLVPDETFSYYFLDDSLNRLYRTEERLQHIFTFFAGLAVLIACLGLFGMASYTVERRVKEIGVRKVLGASVPDVVGMLTHAFIKWVIVANVIAWPSAYFVMNRWLQDYPYRVDPALWIFFVAGSAALLISVLTVGQQAFRAARANPVDSLRYE